MATVLVPLAQGCEELEAVTIMDLMVRAGINVISASLDDKPVTASRGTVLVASTTINKVKAANIDMLVLPGGLPGADNLKTDPYIQNLITQLNDDNKPIAAICAAPKVLAAAGLLNGKKATAYPGVLEELLVKNIQIDHSQAVIHDGNIITSRGPGTAMDFALELITILCGSAKRSQVESGLQRL
ncbi:MAG: DJ-1 family glyoxalase III [Thiohalomonadales bacterium]